MSGQPAPTAEARPTSLMPAHLRSGLAIALCGTVLVATTMLAGSRISGYYYLAAYTILQFIVLGTAWNILGGYAGYVNFGTAGFFAVGCYVSIVLNKLFQLPLLIDMFAAAAAAGLLGLGTGYLTLRLRGVFFSIATLAWPSFCRRSSQTGVSSVVGAVFMLSDRRFPDYLIPTRISWSRL